MQLAICILLSSVSFAQNIAINTTGNPADASALLDIDADPGNNLGLLIPRVSLASATTTVTIASPATSLLVYNTGGALSAGYYYNSGDAVNPLWVQLLNGGSAGPAWLTLGNAATVDGTHFLGTSDNIPLNFRVNNEKAGRIESAANGNTFFGYQSGNVSSNVSHNTGIGYQALLSNTTGTQNTASGRTALYSNSTGSNNTANGVRALHFNTEGHSNTAIGTFALQYNVAGRDATAIGAAAMRYANSTATPFINSNVALGYEALKGSTTAANNTGNSNTALGYQTLLSNTSGGFNTATGVYTLYYNTTGSQNTASGYSALITNTIGSNNTALGYQADVSVNNLTNATAIGNEAIATASNYMRLGNASVGTICGQVDFAACSDMRIKNKVQENVPGLSFIKELRPVTYHYDVDRQNKITGSKDTSCWEGKYDIEKIAFSGFIAQEVEASAKKIGYDFSGVVVPQNDKDIYSLRYSEFVVPLVKAMQEQQKIIDSQQSAITDLSGQIGSLQTENKTIKTQISNLNTQYSIQQKEIEKIKQQMGMEAKK